MSIAEISENRSSIFANYLSRSAWYTLEASLEVQEERGEAPATPMMHWCPVHVRPSAGFCLTLLAPVCHCSMNAMPASAFLVHLETDEAILLLRGHNELPIAEQVCRKAALLQDVRQRPVYDQNTDHGWMSKAPAGLRSSLAYTVHLAPAAGTCVAEGSLLNLWSDHTARSVAYRKGRAYLFDLESNANSHRTGSAHLTGHI